MTAVACLAALGPQPTAARVLLAAYDVWVSAAAPGPAARGAVLDALGRALSETTRASSEALDSLRVLLAARAKLRDAAAYRHCELPPCSEEDLRV